MCKKKPQNIEIERIETEINRGLTDEQVEERINAGYVNKTKMIAGKTYWEIIRTDILSFFNILLFSCAALMIIANIYDGRNETKWYTGTFFVLVLLSNIIIGLYQDLKAKHLMNKLKVITTPKCHVIRNGIEVEIKPDGLVIDDILTLRAGEQIPSDAILLEGVVFANESMLTGESHNVDKKPGDTLYSGSYVTSGTCYARVIRVGKENYIETLTEKAKAFKRNPSHILRSLKVLFRILGVIIIVSAIIIISYCAGIGRFNDITSFSQTIRPVAGQLVAMIPAGLYLLTSFALASGVLSLYRKKANVQDFYSIEMLARSDVICVDKTGTITDGNLQVQKIENLSKLSDDDIKQIIISIVNSTKDENSTAQALKSYFGHVSPFEVVKHLAFKSENKYSGVTDTKGVTYLIGALEFLNVKNKDAYLKQSEEYTSKGYRLLTLARGIAPLGDDKYEGDLEAVAFVVLQDHVKEDAMKTFAWFQENNVQVKVISGDNALTVSEIARAAGINGAEKFISLEGMSLEEVKAIANDYVVFGRVTPEQKEALVIALREAKHTVAMVGDGINDMLALKRADCSIAMNSGSLSARNVSHVVLMDDNFSSMPDVVAEGRRVINNLQRTGSLFLTKTFFAIVMSFLLFMSALVFGREYSYPFSTNNMLLWEVFGIGLVAFFIALEPDSKPIKSGFLRNILKNAVPYAVLIISSTLICMLLYVLQNNGVLYTGVFDYGFLSNNTAAGKFGAAGMSVIVFSTLSIVVLYLTCRPINIYRGIVVGGGLLASAAIVIGCVFSGGRNVLNIDFDKITGENWMAIAAIVVALSVTVITITNIYQGLKRIKKKEEEQHED